MPEKTAPVPVKTSVAPPTALSRPQRAWPPSMVDLRREIDSLFEDFGRNWFGGLPSLREFTAWPQLDLEPAMDVVENGGSFKITAELPGMDAKDIEVSLAGDVLTIRGEKTETREADEQGRHVSERRFGSFERRVRLPEGVDGGKIEGVFTNGLLTVTLPKTEAAKAEPQKIEVKAA